MPLLFDSHTHLQFSAFNKDRDEVIKRTLDDNIWIVNVGSQKDTSRKAVDLANKYPKGVYATIGLHPIHVDKNHYDFQEFDGDNGFNPRGEEFDYEFYKNLARNEKVVAIGECGLDYAVFAREQGERPQKRASADSAFVATSAKEAALREGGLPSEEKLKDKQKEVFIKHVELAHELKKPLMIHCRRAFDDLISILTTNSQLLNTNPGIIHFFTGTLDDAKKLLEIEFYFTFGGLITYNRQLDEIIKFLPLEKILLETDAPYVAPEPYRARLPDGQGKRNEPIYISETAKKLAEIKNVSFEEIARQTTENTLKIFKIK